MALADGVTRTLAINVTDVNGESSADANVAVLTSDGQMTQASLNGMIYAVKNVGGKITLDVTHPVWGSATIETELPMVDPLYVDIQFTGLNRASLSLTNDADLGAFAQRVPGWNQDPAAPEGGGNTCASCMPIGEGVFTGSTCDNGSEADITSCAFSDTVTAWFCYTASCDGTATASTCVGSSYDTTLAAYDSCGGAELACNDDDCPGFLSNISWAVSAGTTYYIRLSGFAGDCGDYTLDVSCVGGGGGDCGNCNVPHDGLGCSDPACEALVCAADPFCCDVGWDQICAD